MMTPREERSTPRRYGSLLAASLLPVLLLLAACNGNTFTQTAPTVGLNTYFVPGTSLNSSNTNAFRSTLQIDHSAATFAQTQYNSAAFLPTQGSAVASSGTVSALPRGLESLATSYLFPGTNPTMTAKTGAFAVELVGDGGFAVLPTSPAVTPTQPVAPFVAVARCPSLSKPEAFLFLTIPSSLTTVLRTDKTSTTATLQSFNLATDAAYGTASISTSGTSVALSNVAQFLFPATPGSAPVALPQGAAAPASNMGVCSPSIYGNTVSVPATAIILGVGSVPKTVPPATLGISPGGFLVEDNAASTINITSQPTSANVLGAGVGTVGLPASASAVSPTTLASTQFQGFFLDTGTTTTSAKSLVASFGFATQPTTCPTVATPTGIVLYGGDYPGNDPTKSADGYGNCDWAIDLGVPDPATNGLFPAATVYPNRAKSYPAVAITGQIAGKYGIFLLGVDGTSVATSSRQAHGIYLIQSN